MPITMKRPQKVVELCTDMSLAGEHERADAELREIEREEQLDPRLAGRKTSVEAAAKRVQQIEQKMTASTLCFTLTALSNKRWTELEGEHEPREDDAVDAAYGVDVSTFVDAAMGESITAVVEKSSGKAVEFAAAEWSALADEMTNAQWDAFALALFQLNKQRTSPDFSKAASRVIRTSSSK